MRLGTLLSGSCLLSLLACAEAPPPAQPLVPEAQPGQAGPPAAPEGQTGAPGLPGQGQVQGQGAPAGAPLTQDADLPPPPPPGEPQKESFKPGDQSIEIRVQLQGFDAGGEPFDLHFVQIMEGDFGQVMPRVVHIATFDGTNPVVVSAPSHMEGPLYLMAIEGEEADRSFSGLEEAILLQDKDLQVTLSRGASPKWMAQLPTGDLPENILGDDAVAEPSEKPPGGPEAGPAHGAAGATPAP